MPKLKILNELGEEVKGYPKCAVGSRCIWTVSSPDGTPHKTVWWVDGAIGDYIVKGEGRHPVKEPTLLELTTYVGNKAEWYWGRVGNFLVKVTAIVSGVKVKRTIWVKVVGPQHLRFTSVTDEVRIARLQPRDPVLALTFGGVAGKHGIEWKAKIIVPPCAGELSFTQVMTVFRQFTMETGEIFTHTSNDQFVLDEAFHYGVKVHGIETAKQLDTVACAADEYLVLEEADSPATNLPRTIDRVTRVYRILGNLEKVEVKEKFKVFMMYKPTNGIWVALGELSWNWAGVAEYENGKWELTSSDFARNPTGNVSVTFPQWSGNRDDVLPG
jgi:hypothetical protein